MAFLTEQQDPHHVQLAISGEGELYALPREMSARLGVLRRGFFIWDQLEQTLLLGNSRKIYMNTIIRRFDGTVLSTCYEQIFTVSFVKHNHLVKR